MKTTRLLVTALLAFGVAVSAAQAQVNIEWVTVGDVGNTSELSGESAGGWGPDAYVGAVDYEYRIGKYEVTKGQYRAMLNAVAALGDPKPQAHWTWVDMEGQSAPFYRPQAILNVGDLNQILFGLMGRPYSWAGNNVDPGDCP
ncbi:MAG: hypothetical protein JSU63_14055 [Phycisphaerales bacterium]|nr:MAG: hypothetical protein JSU63_14055 [Phycisphaerales bacterium]